MRLNKKRLAFIAAWSICAQGRAYPQNPIDQLQPLVEPSAQRLVIAEQVALAKWDSGTAVEDPPREAQVIASAIILERAKQEGWIRRRCQAFSGARSRPSSSFSIRCWQSGVESAKRRITHRSIWPLRLVRS